MIGMRAVRKRSIISILGANLLSLCLSANAVFADDPTLGQAQQMQEIGSKSAMPPSKRSGSARAEAHKPMKKPDGAGNLVYGLINTIRTQSEELCTRYGNPADCLEEAEVCLTMRDTDDNQVRLCLNTVPGDSGGKAGTVQKSRLRR